MEGEQNTAAPEERRGLSPRMERGCENSRPGVSERVTDRTPGECAEAVTQTHTIGLHLHSGGRGIDSGKVIPSLFIYCDGLISLSGSLTLSHQHCIAEHLVCPFL